MDISLFEIEYFLKVAELKNISKASEVLGIRQSSLSASIQKLEHQLGTSLFIRSKKGVELTLTGEFFLNHSRDLINQWLSLKSQTLSLNKEISGTYSIGIHPTAGRFFLPKFLPELIEQNPNLKIKLYHDNSPRLVDAVIDQKIDFAIVTDPKPHGDLIIKNLIKDEVSFWQIPKLQTKHNKTLICDPNLLHTQLLLKKAHKAKVNFDRIIETSNIEVIRNLIDTGMGIGIMPAIAAQGLVKMPNAPITVGQISLIYRYDRMENKAKKIILNYLLNLKA